MIVVNLLRSGNRFVPFRNPVLYKSPAYDRIIHGGIFSRFGFC